PEPRNNRPAPAATAPAAAARPQLRVFRPDNPYVALGLAVNHLMTKPAFANCKFGDWSRILVGQINRRHFWFVVDANNQIVGFMGLAMASKDKAESWVEGRAGLSYDDHNDGQCLVFNDVTSNNIYVNHLSIRD